MVGIKQRSSLALDFDVAVALRGQMAEAKAMEEARAEMNLDGGGEKKTAENMMGPRRH
jgi:hypothetical protein